jgi:CRISPR/Cas system CMR subunit Cmr6 (Cas7 group RAMP superfamily)
MKIPKLPSVFKNHTYRSARRFSYKPLYYNEAKERLEEQIAKAKQEAKIEEEIKSGKGNSHLQFSRNLGNYRKQQSKSSNFRLVVILAILALMAYWLLN